MTSSSSNASSNHPRALPGTVAAIETGIDQGLHLGAQLCVYHDDELICDMAIGQNAPGTGAGQQLTTDHWMNWFSAGKPIVAAGIMKLWQWGRFDLDDPVAKYLPAFATNGKEAITIKHLLTHTAGIRMVSMGWPRASWQEIIAALCDAKIEPRWIPGQKAGYHALTTWFLLGELIRLLDTSLHRMPDLFIRDEILEPTGMSDTWLAMTSEQIDREPDRIGIMYDTAKVLENAKKQAQTADSDSATSSIIHHQSSISAYPSDWSKPPRLTTLSPGSSLRGPAHDMARFYRMLLKQGRIDGVEVLSPTTVQTMIAPHRVGMHDHTFNFPVPWGLGLILTPPNNAPPLPPYGFGPTASPGSFGHSGHQSSTVFADPKHQLVVALICNGMCGNQRHDQRTNAIIPAIYSDLQLR